MGGSQDEYHLPLCMVTVDVETLRPTTINDVFEECIGPLFKFQDSDFVLAASEESDFRDRFRKALEEAKNGSRRTRVRNVEMTTLTGASGFPECKPFDWFIRLHKEKNALVLLGDMMGGADEEEPTEASKTAQRENFIMKDFYQNAPIALHRLSGEGKILWANQTELDCLGYKAEEFIGQNIMKFCPDDTELFEEIFRQLGSAKIQTLRDLGARFRTKDGEVKYLMIDSNVRWEKDGSFGNTRCFVRDDTGRQIREAKANLILEETKRSLKMLDNFLARSLHHLRTPLHVTQNMVDAIALYFKTHPDTTPETQECRDMVQMANDQISQSVAFLDDLADLAKFDQGAVLPTHPKEFDLEKFGKKLLLKDFPTTRENVKAKVEFRKGDWAEEGPVKATTDSTVLRRILKHLLSNAADATEQGSVALQIGYHKGRLTFGVADTGPGLEMPTDAAEGDLPVIFQRYHQELLPEETDSLQVATSLREKIETGINNHKRTGMGIGLSLTYHLVQALGGELRCHSVKNEGTRFHFSLPCSVSQNDKMSSTATLRSSQVTRSFVDDGDALLKKAKPAAPKPKLLRSTSSGSHASITSIGALTMGDETEGSTASGVTSKRVPVAFDDIPKEIKQEVPLSCTVSKGINSQDPPSILVVEDTPTCAKMLCRILSRFKCATNWAENGKIAVDLLKEAPPGTYDLILMDLRMPVMDGLEATRIIKSQLGISTPVVALTGDDNEKTRKEAIEIGFDAFYGKPLKRKDLKKVVQEFTGYQVA